MKRTCLNLCVSVVLLLFTSWNAFSCSCDWSGPFMQVALADLVVRVKVIKHLTFQEIRNKQRPMSMEVEVLEVLKGQESRATIKIWGDDGASCRPDLSMFPEGTTWLMALYCGEECGVGLGHTDEKRTDYAIYNCGQYWVEVKGESVHGNLDGKSEFVSTKHGLELNAQAMSLSDFKHEFYDSLIPSSE